MNTDYGSLAEHLEDDREDEHIRLEGEEYQRYVRNGDDRGVSDSDHEDQRVQRHDRRGPWR